MNSKIKVVHLTTVHHPYDPRIYYKQCMSLHEAGYDVILIAKSASEKKDLNSKKITHIPLKEYQNRIKRMIFGSIDIFKKAKKQNAKIYVFHDPELLLVGWLLKRRHNIVIYDIHEDYVTSILQKKYLPKMIRKAIAKLYRMIEILLIKRMELSLAEKYYQEIYKNGTCILNYPLIAEYKHINSSDNNVIENKLLYTGNVTKDRGAIIQAEIPKFINYVDVYFIGMCSKELAETMYEVAGNRKDQIIIEGIDRFIEKEQMEKTYAEHRSIAGIALFPPTDHYKKKELTKFFEYMNAGLPILCSNFPVWKEFIDTYECGIAVDPYDKNAIHSAIERLRNDINLNRKMGNNGRKAVMEKLNWKAEETKLLNWYEQLIKDSGS